MQTSYAVEAPGASSSDPPPPPTKYYRIFLSQMIKEDQGPLTTYISMITGTITGSR